MKYDISLLECIEKERLLNKENNRLIILKECRMKLKKYFSHNNIKKVFLFGSILKEHEYDINSDIDIAVSGIKSEDYFKIYEDIENMLKTENIDLIELDKCSFKKVIEKYGERIV